MRSPASAPWVLAVAIAGSAMVFIDSTAVNVALPVLQRDLRADAASMQWVVEGYSLVLSAFILIGGALGDRFGRRLTFLWGVVVFAFASLLCAVSQNVVELNAARCLQGLGGAFATPGSLSLLTAAYDPGTRGKAIGTWSGFTSLTAAIGPVLGGWLTQAYSWRLVFLINLPIAAFVILAALFHVAESRDEHATGPVDFVGAVLATTGLALMTYGLISMQGSGGGGWAGLVCAAGVVVIALFVLYESRASNPMVPLGIFKNRLFAGTNLYTLVLYAAIGGSTFFVPFELQYVEGYSPLAAGAALLPFVVIMFVSARWSGGLVDRIGARTPLIAGALIATLALCVYAFSGIGHSFWLTYFPASVLFGCGAALFVAPLTTTVMDALPTDQAGIASGVNNAVARVASVLAIAIFGIVLIDSFYASFDRRSVRDGFAPQTMAALHTGRALLTTLRPPAGTTPDDRPRVSVDLRHSYADGFRNAMLGGAALCVVAAGIAALTIPPKKRVAPSS